MPQSVPLQPDETSKSRRKKEMIELQKLGESLLALSESQLAEIEMPANLLEAIKHAKTLATEAKRRQLQYIGKLMRHVDPEPIRMALKQIQLARQNTALKFQLTEQWRAKLITHGDAALNTFLTAYPNVDKQALRQLIRKAQHDKKVDKNTGAEKALFIFLREILKE